MTDIKAQLLELFAARGDNRFWPADGLNVDWLRALYCIKYGYPDADQLFGDDGGLFVVNECVVYEKGCSAAFQSALRTLVADGVIEFDLRGRITLLGSN